MEVVVVGEGDERAVVPRQPACGEGVLRQQELRHIAPLVCLDAAIALGFWKNYNVFLSVMKDHFLSNPMASRLTGH